MRCHLFALVGVLAACDSGSASGKNEAKGAEPERKLAGVFPDQFSCETIIKPEELASMLGAIKATPQTSPMTMPRGLAAPCTYAVTTETALESWTFDFDCRDNMKQRADALFAQYKRTSAELVEAYNAASDAGIKPTGDAGVIPSKPPEDAVEVQVGAKALDHHGQGLLFIDDDAPCYVRVVGPDAPRRLALAQHVAKHLTFMNAPMTPRPAP